MKKYIAAIGALVALAVPTAAIAGVTYDDASVGTVGKGDVQTLFGWNDATLQAKVKSGDVKFTGKYVMSNATRWSCSDGSIQQQESRVTQSRALNVTPIFNASANKVTGFTLNGIDMAKAGTYVSGERVGAPYVGHCPAGWFTGFLPNVFTNTVVPGVYVNGVDLPVTPVDVPSV